MIDVKDLQVGSLVQDPNGKLLVLKDINSVFLVCESLYRSKKRQTIVLEGTYSIEDLRPIPITTAWLTKLGLTPEPGAHGRIYHDIPTTRLSLELRDDQAKLFDGPHAFKSLESIHHLQSLVWNLERVWLTLTTPQPCLPTTPANNS